MGCETSAACWETPVSQESVSMEPGMMPCRDITAILVNLKGLVPYCIFLSNVTQKKKLKKKFTWSSK